MAKTKGAKTGRYGTNITKEEFEKLCAIMCTQQEICGFFRVSHDTLLRWCKQEYGMTFEETFDQFSSDGKVSLRRTQFEQAKTNPTMAIFLGKQYLGQQDVVENKVNTRIEVYNDVPIED